MRLTPILLAPSVDATAHTAYAADTPAVVPAPCVDPDYLPFDFWIGNWSVTENGKPAGSNHVDRLLEGCALRENWVGVDCSRGHSLNFYDSRRGVWQQTWIDNSTGALNLTCRFSDRHMVPTGASNDLKTHAQRIDRIT